MLSFKLEFPSLNNTAEYEAYLTGLATALEIGVNHLKVICPTWWFARLKGVSL